MTGPMIALAMTGDRTGYVIATMPPPGPYRAPGRLVVGDVYRISPDDQPEEWKAWLWPVAGGSLHTTRSCDALEAPNTVRLTEKARKRAEKEPWWGKSHVVVA